MQSNETFVLYIVQQGHIQITLTTNNLARIYAYDIHAQQFIVQKKITSLQTTFIWFQSVFESKITTKYAS